MPLLEVDGLTKRFGSFEAISDVDVSFEEGQIYALIGPNGAGKTTFFNTITGQMSPSEGTVRFDGEDITGADPHEITRKGLARSFQITNIFEGLTVFENVRLAVQARLANNFDLVSRVSKIDDLEAETNDIIRRIGLDDVANHKVANLPYGQKRQLEVGLSIGLNPKMLLLDEPTAGMAHSEINTIVNLIGRLAEDYSVLLVEHNMDIVMDVAEYIYVLAQGELVAEGSPEDIQNNNKVREIYLGGQHA